MSDANETERIARLESALARLETRMGKVELVLGMGHDEDVDVQHASEQPAKPKRELELAIGQNLFAKVGIVVLAIGGMLTLSLPWKGASPMMPSTIGWLLAAGLFVLARLLQNSMAMNARFFRGAGMSLLLFASLRLLHFTDPAVLQPTSLAAAVLMGGTVLANLVMAWWRKSVVLSGLALLGGHVAALAIGTTGFVFLTLTLLLVWASVASRHHRWQWLPVFVIPFNFIVYLVWAIGNPQLGHAPKMASEPVAALAMLLLWIVMAGLVMATRRNREPDQLDLPVGTVFNAGGYAVFLLHTMTGFPQLLASANIVASVVLLALAVMFWLREHCHFATFVYAMTGYAALTVALIKLSELPDLFVWLSAQSLLVVVTALWFRSRFIIVANFLIYLGVISGYMMLVEEESGISLIFVWVALTSARILKWQKDRLELKTELMRNAYLTSAFIVFPYALYHIVPAGWVAPAWVGIALFYYVMTMVTKAKKYRWMGHNTLLLTVVYILITSIGRLEGTQRVLSFLLLGTVLLVVSLVFTVIHSRKQKAAAGDAQDGPPP